MGWTVESVKEQFGEDLLRDICRDVNDLMAGRAGYGHDVNRIGVPDSIWRKLLRSGGYTDEGVRRAMNREHLVQTDTCGPFQPYTILTLVNITDEMGGPLTAAELDQLFTCALNYRQLP